MPAARRTRAGPGEGAGRLFGAPAAAELPVDGLARRQRLQQVLEMLADITHGALLSPPGRAARETLLAWGFPASCLDHLELGYFPDPGYVARELTRRGCRTWEDEGAALLEPHMSGRVVGPWRSRRGRILTFFAWRPEQADRRERYAFAPWRRPDTLFGKHRALSPAPHHLCLVEGVLDVLLASCFGVSDVLAFGGPIAPLWPRRLERLAASGIRELTVIPPDDEAGRLDVLTLLDAVGCSPSVEVFVVDPALLSGATDLGDLVRERGSESLMDIRAGRMEGNVYRLVLVPW